MGSEEKLLAIMRVMNNKFFGFRFSEKIVGGRTRLERLITAAKNQERYEPKKVIKSASTANG